MGFIDVIKERAKAANKTIVLPETEDRRTYEAAAQILKEGIAKIILVGSEEAVKKGSEGLDLTGAVVVDPATSDTESLNVANAGSMIMYEYCRQNI